MPNEIILFYDDVAELTGYKVETLHNYLYLDFMPRPDGRSKGRTGRPWWYESTILAWMDRWKIERNNNIGGSYAREEE